MGLLTNYIILIEDLVASVIVPGWSRSGIRA